MLQWKRLQVLEKFENGRLPKIVQASIDKMGLKRTLDLPTWKLPKATAKE